VTEKISLVIATGLLFLSLGIGPDAHAQLASFPGAKSLLLGPDPIGIGKDVATQFTFEITLNANNFDASDNVMDVIPAEFDVMSLDPSCGMAESQEGEAQNKGGPAGGNGDAEVKLAPDFILWDLEGCDSTTAQTLSVVIQTDPNPGHAKRGIPFYEPTSCGPLFLNDGAVLMAGEDIEPMTEPSNALVVASCPDETDVGCDDADDDGWSVACGDTADDDSTSFPGADEICGDGRDNDLDGEIDEDCLPDFPIEPDIGEPQ
jgi:hypothetical protein